MRWLPRTRRRRLTLAGAGIVCALTVTVAPWAVVRYQSAAYVHDGPGPGGLARDDRAPVALVLGAGLDASGQPGGFLSERLQLAADLYREHRVSVLLMSGDHSRTDHDEVDAMSARAQALGVPASAIVLDHAGFDTYSSCYRLRSVWAVDRAIVVTQPFHLARALWLCRQFGIDAIGAATVNGDNGPTRYGWIREIPATGKSLLDVWRGRVPEFPGPREHTLDGVSSPPADQ